VAPRKSSAWRRERIQRLALAACGAFPDRFERLGRERGGRRLEPDLELLVRVLDRLGWPDFAELSPVAARAEIEREALLMAPPPTPDVSVRTLQLPGSAGALPARLYVPAGACSTLLLYFHGGGWVFGSPATHDGLCRLIARHGRVRVLSASYRLAPEHRFPAAVEDAGAALGWTRANLGAPEVDRIGVGGDSAGATLATVLAGEASEALAFQLLFYPVTDLSREHPSYATFADGPVLTARQMRWFRSHYLAREEDARDPRASPLLAPSLSGMPPAYLALAGFDPLYDEGVAYGDRLRHAGVEVSLADQRGQAHAFAELTRASRSARAALLQACAWVREQSLPEGDSRHRCECCRP
jgi:acetyl esterase